MVAAADPGSCLHGRLLRPEKLALLSLWEMETRLWERLDSQKKQRLALKPAAES